MKLLKKLAAIAALLAVLVPTAHALLGRRDDPVMAGYDLVAYHSLNALDDGTPGTPDYSVRHNGYLYYYANQANLDTFVANPDPYLPMYGGFCAWGIAWEYPEEGWPWASDHMGPPCGPRDGWALLTDPTTGDKRLYCSIWRSYQDDFNRRQEEGMRLANQRWMDFYGSLQAGPKNNGCYAWNWQECFATSIYNPLNNHMMATNPTQSPTLAPSQSQTLFQEDSGLATGWSDTMTVLNGTLVFQYTLQDVASIRPLLVVDLMYELDDEFDALDNQYLGFGVAEQVMQGALVVCSPDKVAAAVVDSSTVSVAKTDEGAIGTSTCKTYLGSGMGITEPATDPVQPTVLESELNSTHYRVRFTANLFACWSNPVWPARVLFSRGLVSGNGDPMPHLNNLKHRQAVEGVEFLSVVSNSAAAAVVVDGPPAPLELEPLPSSMVEVDGTSGSLEILEGRVTVEYGLYTTPGSTQKEEVVQIQLLNVPFDPEDDAMYVGFGFATDTMSGLIMTCAPSVDESTDELTATCHQWRGLGTNLYPRSLVTDAGGWFLTLLEGNGTHVNYTLAGRTSDVFDIEGDGLLTADTNLRAICALGRFAPDTGTPLMHTSRDRTPMVLDRLTAAAVDGSSSEKSGKGEEEGVPATATSLESSAVMRAKGLAAMALLGVIMSCLF